MCGNSFMTLGLITVLWVVSTRFYQRHLQPVLKPEVDDLALQLAGFVIVVVNQIFVLPRTTEKPVVFCLGQVRVPA